MQYELIILGNTLAAWQATAEAAFKGLRVALVTGCRADAEHPTLDGHDLLAHAQSLVERSTIDVLDEECSESLMMPQKRWQRFQQQLRRTALRELRGTLDWLEMMRVPVYKSTCRFRDHRHLQLDDPTCPVLAGERFLLAHASSSQPSSSWPMLLQLLASPSVRQSQLRASLLTLEALFQEELCVLPTLITREAAQISRLGWLQDLTPSLKIVAAEQIHSLLYRAEDESFPYLIVTRDRQEIPVSRFLIEGERQIDWSSWRLPQADVMADDRGVLWADPRQQTTNPSVYALPHLTSSFSQQTLSMPQLINQLCLELHSCTPRPHLLESRSLLPR